MTLPIQGNRPVSIIPATGTTTVTNAAATGADQVVLAANTVRARVIISNQNAVRVMYINFGAAAGLGAGFTLQPLAYWDSGNGPCPTDAIHLLGTALDLFTVLEI